MNARQTLVLNHALDGLEGKLTNAKWAAMGKCSADTALRDINDLMERGVLRRLEGGVWGMGGVGNKQLMSLDLRSSIFSRFSSAAFYHGKHC